MLSLVQLSTHVPREDSQGKLGRGDSCSLLGRSTVVPYVDGDRHATAFAAGCTFSDAQRKETSSQRQTQTSCELSIRQLYESRGISKAAVSDIMSSWRPSTKSQYEVYLKKWYILCCERQLD